MVEDTLFFLVAVPLALVATAALDIPALSSAAVEIQGQLATIALIAAAALLVLGILLRLGLGGGVGRESSRLGSAGDRAGAAAGCGRTGRTQGASTG